VVEINEVGKFVGFVAEDGVGFVWSGGQRRVSEVERSGEKVGSEVHIVCHPGGEGVVSKGVFHFARRYVKGLGRGVRGCGPGADVGPEATVGGGPVFTIRVVGCVPLGGVSTHRFGEEGVGVIEVNLYEVPPGRPIGG